MIDRGPVAETKYEDIDDELIRSDLELLVGKLKREVINNPIRLKMPLAEFSRKWLSMFICKIDDETREKGVPISEWVRQVTQNPYTWVDIIEPSGNIAYSVPPLLNSDAVDIKHVDFYHHIMEMQAMVDHGAAKGEVEQYRQQNILTFIGSNPNAKTYIEEINKMAMYHGYAPFTGTVADVKLEDDSNLNFIEKESVGFGEITRVDDF